jgi:hypothetical protein
MSGEAWLQWLLVGGPVLSLIGAWMSLKAYGKRPRRRQGKAGPAAGERAAKATEKGGEAGTG